MCRDLVTVGEGVVESGCYQLVSNNNNTVVALIVDAVLACVMYVGGDRETQKPRLSSIVRLYGCLRSNPELIVIETKFLKSGL